MTHAAAHLLVGALALGLSATAVVARAGAPRPPRAEPDHAAREAPLEGRVLTTSTALALPTRIAVAGDYLAVIDAASDSALHVLDRHTGRLVRSVGRRGKGPGEFDGAWSLAPQPDAGHGMWVYDLPLHRLTLVPLPFEEQLASARRTVRLVDGAVLTGPVWITGAVIVTPGFLLDARVAVFDSAGQRIGALGQPPYGPRTGHPMQAAQALLAVHPDGSRVAIANRYVSRIELLAVGDGTARTVWGPVAVNAGRKAIDLGHFAYLDVAASASAVVALFSGRSREAFEDRAVFGDRLHVFDWEGRLQAEITLDADVLAIALAARDGIVYALRHDPEPAVVRYRLPRRRGYRYGEKL